MALLEVEFTLPLWLLIVWLVCMLLLLGGWTATHVVARNARRTLENHHELTLLDVRNELKMVQSGLAQAQDEKKQLAAQYQAEQQRTRGLQLELRELQVRTQERERARQAELATLQSAKETLSKEFENIANRLFEQKQEVFTRQAKSQLEGLILPFRDQLQEFRTRVDEAQKLDIAQRNQLLGQISELQRQSQQIGLDAVNLANALKGNNKVMGNWGEWILTRILDQMGFQEGREYALQVTHKDSDGRRLQPDAVIYLPDGRDVVIDSKVSLLAYERHVCAETDAERERALKEHLDSLRSHIRNLSGKNYSEWVKRGSVEFVCLFVPVEAAFVSAIQAAPEILQEAFDKKVVLVSPSSLFVVLKSVSVLWQRELQNRNVERIAESAGKLYDQFVRFLESMVEVGAGLDKASKSYETAMNRLSLGNGNLVKRTEELRRLGAKTSKVLPQRFRDGLESQTIDESETQENFDD